MRKVLVGTCAAIAVVAALCADAATPDWQVLSRFTVGGTGGWDLLAVDAPSRRLFVTRGEELMVIDVDSGKLLGSVPGLKRAHGVALVPAKKRGYVSSGGDDKVIAFDLDTLKPRGEIAVNGKNPDAMLFDTASQHVFAFNGRSNNASVIDPATDKVVASIELPGKPELAVSDEHGSLFVNIADKNQVAQIDAKTGKVTETWSLGSCEDPSGLAIDVQHKRLFSVCSNKQMVVLDARDGHVVATVTIGDEPDGAAFDAQTGNAFSSNSDGTLTVVHEDDADHYHVLATVATPSRSRTIAVDAKTHHVVLPTAQFGVTPAPTAEQPHPRPSMTPDSFGFIVVGQK
jgi:YVTN family beta-propeller protein